ncbi:MAG: class I SAM-dependent methyltransferase [Reichenbachiella sp.]
MNKFNTIIFEGISLLSNPLGWKIIRSKLSYLRIGALNNIRDTIKEVENKKIKGLFVEAGCALGGSSIQIASAKATDRKLNIYDVFGMIPPPGSEDDQDVVDRFSDITEGKSKGIRGDKYYGYHEDLKGEVSSNLTKFGFDPKTNNIELIQGLYEESMEINDPVAFAHIDCDWYSSVMTCLEQIEPHMSLNGVMIIDDYYVWSGCKKAIDEYFDDNRKSAYKFYTRQDKLHIEKIK